MVIRRSCSMLLKRWAHSTFSRHVRWKRSTKPFGTGRRFLFRLPVPLAVMIPALLYCFKSETINLNGLDPASKSSTVATASTPGSGISLWKVETATGIADASAWQMGLWPKRSCNGHRNYRFQLGRKSNGLQGSQPLRGTADRLRPTASGSSSSAARANGCTRSSGSCLRGPDRGSRSHHGGRNAPCP